MPRKEDGVGKLEQAELLQLSELHQGGQVSDEQYELQRRRIISRTAALKATSRAVDGASSEAIIVDKSLGPLVAKLLIGLFVLSVGSSLGWVALKKYVIDYRPQLAEPPVPAAEPPATAPPPPVTTETPAKLEAPAVAPAALVPVPTPVPTPQTPAPTPPPAPPSPLESQVTFPATTSVVESPAESTVEPPPKPTVIWNVNLPDRPADGHPFEEWCHALKVMTAGRVSVVIGVTVGPTATDTNDPAYKTFRDDLFNQFEQRATAADPDGLTSFHQTPRPVRTGKLMTDRKTATRANSNDMVMLAATVQDGRAYMYWFQGDSKLQQRFLTEVVGTASAATTEPPASTEPAAPSTPAAPTEPSTP